MPKTVQIRDIDDDVYAELARRAADVGITVPELLRREVIKLAARPSLKTWLDRTRRRPSEISTPMVIDALDELRGPWPDVDR